MNVNNIFHKPKLSILCDYIKKECKSNTYVEYNVESLANIVHNRYIKEYETILDDSKVDYGSIKGYINYLIEVKIIELCWINGKQMIKLRE